MKDYSEYSVEDFNIAFMRFYEALTYGKQPVKSPTEIGRASCRERV